MHTHGQTQKHMHEHKHTLCSQNIVMNIYFSYADLQMQMHAQKDLQTNIATQLGLGTY